jgi:hypothetical protein
MRNCSPLSAVSSSPTLQFRTAVTRIAESGAFPWQDEQELEAAGHRGRSSHAGFRRRDGRIERSPSLTRADDPRLRTQTSARAHRSSYRCRIVRRRVTVAQTSRGQAGHRPSPPGRSKEGAVRANATPGPGSVSVAIQRTLAQPRKLELPGSRASAARRCWVPPFCVRAMARCCSSEWHRIRSPSGSSRMLVSTHI